MNLALLINERNELRDRWRAVRDGRLELKRILTEKNLSLNKSREYKLLKKEQRHLSKMLKHIEKKIYRKKISGKNRDEA